jgi:acetyl esterase
MTNSQPPYGRKPKPVQLHPEIAGFFGAMSGLQPPMEEREASEVRQLMDSFALRDMKPRPDDIEVEDHWGEFPGRRIRLRLYKPKGAIGPLPVMLYFHGGGWVIGNIDTHDRYVCMLTQSSGVAYLAVDYRLASEHPYPAAIEDAFASLEWVHARAGELGLDPDCIGISGDSAGGQLTAACTLMARERGGPKVAFQLLIYPLTDCDFSRPSYHTWDGLLLTTPYMKWLWRQWVGDKLPVDDVRAVPLRAELHDLPPAYVVTCEFDILRDEGELYAFKLMDARVPVTLRRVPGMTHPFFRAMDVSPYVRSEMREMGRQIRRYLVDTP